MGKGWKKCGKKLCGETMEKMWKAITWEKCGKFVKRIVWKKCRKEYYEKSVENMWKTITWENYGKTVKKIVWKIITWESVENNNTWEKWERAKPC